MDSLSCLKKFRFRQRDLPRLATLLDFPDSNTLDNRCRVSGIEALCVMLRRLASKGRGHDLAEIFCQEDSVINRIFAWSILHVYNTFGHMLRTFERPWLTKETLDMLAMKNVEKGCAFLHCIGFVDGTLDRICRPTGFRLQKQAYCYKKFHALKSQGVMGTNGIILLCNGPYCGKFHDAKVAHISKLATRMEALNASKEISMANRYILYGDKAYKSGLYIVPAFKDPELGSPQSRMNDRMKSVRISVEWGFGKVGNLFRFIRDGDSKKVLLQPVGMYLPVAVLLSNLHTCIYGSQTSTHFGCDPPTCEEYLRN